MSDEPLTNAAVEVVRAVFERRNSSYSPPRPSASERERAMTDDFLYDDRRSGVNFGQLDESGYWELIETAWATRDGNPQRSILDVIAVRGQRAAAIKYRLSYSSETYIELIGCTQVDPTLRRVRRQVQFDADAGDDAIALLDEWHAEIGD